MIVMIFVIFEGLQIMLPIGIIPIASHLIMIVVWMIAEKPPEILVRENMNPV